MLQFSGKQYGLPRLLHPAAAPNLRLPATEFARSLTFTVRQHGGRRTLSLSRFVVHIFRSAGTYQKATRIEIVDSPLPRFLGSKVGSKVGFSTVMCTITVSSRHRFPVNFVQHGQWSCTESKQQALD